MARSPNGHIVAIVKAVRDLKPALRDLWDQCETRECNLGYDCGDKPWTFTQAIPHRMLRAMAEVGLSFRITLYGKPRD